MAEVKSWHCGVFVTGAFRRWSTSTAALRATPAGGLRRPGRGACTGRPPASDLGTVRSARTLSTGSRHRLIVFRGPPAGRRAAGRVGVDRSPRSPHPGHGARLVGAVPIRRDVIPTGGRTFHDPDFPPPQIRPLPHVDGPAGDLVQLWLGPRLCSPRSPAGPTISAECAVCGVGVSTLRNTCPPAGITSRRMGPESIQRAPRPTSGNTEPQGGVTRPAKARPAKARPAKARPPAGHLTARPTATAPEATDEAGRPRRPRRNPPRLSKIRDTRGCRPVHAPRPGRRRPPAGERGCP